MVEKRQAEADEIIRRLADGTARKTYHLTREAWYAPHVEATVREHADHVWNITIETLGSDGTLGEFFIHAFDFHRTGVLSLKVSVFHDAYPALLAVPDFLPSVMASADGATYEQVNDILARLGFVDATPRQNPAGVA